MSRKQVHLTRRRALQSLGGAAGIVLLGGCAGDGTADDGLDGSQPGIDATGEDAAPGTCTVYPQQTEGPYYLDDDLVRQDITGGKSGTPLALRLRVLGADGCTPLAGVAVDVWQCDAGGVYSGFPGQLGGVNTTGQTFLRGTQLTGSDGRVQFTSLYPGWYPGRTTHIHFKIHPTAGTEATSQLYFPEATTMAVYQTGVYAARGQKDTSNAADGVNQGSVPPLLDVTQVAGGYEAALVITVMS